MMENKDLKLLTLNAVILDGNAEESFLRPEPDNSKDFGQWKRILETTAWWSETDGLPYQSNFIIIYYLYKNIY